MADQIVVLDGARVAEVGCDFSKPHSREISLGRDVSGAK
jgi:hypothetical protein